MLGHPTLQYSHPGSSVTAVDSQLAKALRDRYVLERELGRGGMATVYLAAISDTTVRSP